MKVEFKIDQVLHGYKQGHKLLETSLKISERSEAVMLALSDLLTSTPLSYSESYVSGYPLRADNKFVLARTWAAPESSRPGSVWTHSLILDYAGLAVIEDLSILLALFRRPRGGTDSSYGMPITSKEFQIAEPVKLEIGPPHRAENLLQAIYTGKGAQRIDLPVTTPDEDEGLAIAIWRQMWPRLRRDFAFFSRATGPIRDVSASFFLEFRTDVDQSKTKQVASKISYSALLADLKRPGPTELRQFLARYTLDAEDPRGVVPALVDLFEEGADPGALSVAFGDASSVLWSLPRLKRDILVKAISGKERSAALKVLHLFRDEEIGSFDAEALRNLTMWETGKPSALAQIFEAALPSERGKLGYTVFETTARAASAETLARVPAPEDTKLKLLRFNPEIVAYPAFWPADASDRSALLDAALDADIAPTEILKGIGRNLGQSDISVIVKRSSYFTEILLDRALSDLDTELIRSLFKSLSNHPDLIERVVRRSDLLPSDIGESLAIEAIKQGYSKQISAEIWEKLIPEKNTRTSSEPLRYLHTCGFMAAQEAKLPVALKLLRKTLDPVYEAANRYRLPRDCRDALEMIARHSQEWRLSAKLIDITLDIFDRGTSLDVELFLVTDEREIATEIFRAAQRRYGRPNLVKFAARAKQSSIIKKTEAFFWLTEYLSPKRRSSWWF